jgi:hypothetical protein
MVLAVLIAGCSRADDEIENSCPLSMEYNDATYYPLKTEHPVQGEESLGSVGFACITDDEAGRIDAEARFPAQSLRDVDPAVAFVMPSRYPRYVFYSGPSDASSFPPGAQELLNR